MRWQKIRSLLRLTVASRYRTVNARKPNESQMQGGRSKMPRTDFKIMKIMALLQWRTARAVQP